MLSTVPIIPHAQKARVLGEPGLPHAQKTRVLSEPGLLSQQKVHYLQVNTNVPLMLIMTNFLHHVLPCFILLLQRSRVSEGYRGKPVTVVQQNTFQRSLAAVNEQSPIFWLVLSHSKLVQGLCNNRTVHQVIVFIGKNGVTLHV